MAAILAASQTPFLGVLLKCVKSSMTPWYAYLILEFSSEDSEIRLA